MHMHMPAGRACVRACVRVCRVEYYACVRAVRAWCEMEEWKKGNQDRKERNFEEGNVRE